MQHGFVSHDDVDKYSDIPPGSEDNEDKLSSPAGIKQPLPHEMQRSAVDAMLTFVNKICGRHEGPRMMYKQLHIQVMGEIWSQSDLSTSYAGGRQRPDYRPP